MLEFIRLSIPLLFIEYSYTEQSANRQKKRVRVFFSPNKYLDDVALVLTNTPSLFFWSSISLVTAILTSLNLP
jgi:hypothetical protein